MKIQKLGPELADQITKVALKGKAFWGYDEAFMESVRDELTCREASFKTKDLFGAFVEGRLVGYYALLQKSQDTGTLEDMFILPEFIGKGIGRALWTHCLQESRKRGWVKITADSDPFAEGFYKRMGFDKVGVAPSDSIPGRMLPLMEFRL